MTEKGAAKPSVNVEALVEELELEVEARCASLMASAKDKVEALRNEFQVQLMKLPKKVRELPMKDFRLDFSGDIKAVLLEDINSRLASDLPIDSAASVPATGRKTRGGGAATATTLDTDVKTTRKRGRAGGAEVMEAPPPRTTRRNKPATDVKSTPLPAARSTAANSAPQATPMTTHKLVPFTPAPHAYHLVSTPAVTCARIPRAGETFYSQNGSPLGVCAAEETDDIPSAA
ncbi:hypothetical protein CYMTET_53638 [Cymbomonas tetramitiformis]|uniref:Borealin N-terminal domain-containing protein n=1 Tax=Cymbomonas tetramitiformis TaxID=36881 RepID=A0AAE0BHY7_9CHLO|nr:hypothetical protein CYMTET_53638 [Cymbomonas tetramitiformis]